MARRLVELAQYATSGSRGLTCLDTNNLATSKYMEIKAANFARRSKQRDVVQVLRPTNHKMHNSKQTGPLGISRTFLGINARDASLNPDILKKVFIFIVVAARRTAAIKPFDRWLEFCRETAIFNNTFDLIAKVIFLFKARQSTVRSFVYSPHTKYIDRIENTVCKCEV